jgi:hypothetical protein
VQFDIAKFVNIDRDTPMLLPHDMRDWFPSNHLVHFMIDAIESVDTSMAQINHRGTGSEHMSSSHAFGAFGLFLLHGNIFQ